MKLAVEATLLISVPETGLTANPTIPFNTQHHYRPSEIMDKEGLAGVIKKEG